MELSIQIYRGEIEIACKVSDIDELKQKLSSEFFIVQLIVLPKSSYSIIETDNLSETERGSGGLEAQKPDKND